MVSPRSVIREVAVVDVTNGENVGLRRGVHGRQREHDHGVENKPPLDTVSAIDGVKQCSHTFEEQHDEHP